VLDLQSSGASVLDAERRVTREAAVCNVVLVAENTREPACDVATAELALAICGLASTEHAIHATHLRLPAPLYGVAPQVVNG
jgi:hypothetical protein